MQSVGGQSDIEKSCLGLKLFCENISVMPDDEEAIKISILEMGNGRMEKGKSLTLHHDYIGHVSCVCK